MLTQMNSVLLLLPFSKRGHYFIYLNMKAQIAVLALFLTTAALADTYQPLPTTLAVTATVSNPDVSTDGVVETYPKPKRARLTTSTLLKLIAVGEFNETNWPSKSFPHGAKLVLMYDRDDVGGSYFVVTDSKGNTLLDVSDLLRFVVYEEAVVKSGKVNLSTGAQTKVTLNYYAYFFYSDVEAGGETFFDLSGVATDETDDTLKNAVISETQTVTFSSAQGSGEIKGKAATVSASIKIRGKNPFQQ